MPKPTQAPEDPSKELSKEISKELSKDLSRELFEQHLQPMIFTNTAIDMISTTTSIKMISATTAPNSAGREPRQRQRRHKAMEETPGTAREEMTPDKTTESALVAQRQLARKHPELAGLAEDLTSGNAREKTALDKTTESALAIERQLARNRQGLVKFAQLTEDIARGRPCPNSPPLPWLSSGMTGEKTPNELRTFYGEVDSPCNESSSSTIKPSSSYKSEVAAEPLNRPQAAPSELRNSPGEVSSSHNVLSFSSSESNSLSQSEGAVKPLDKTSAPSTSSRESSSSSNKWSLYSGE